MATNPVIDRIRKLLEMSTANGATEAEADTAMRLAAGLAAKHGIELSTITAGDEKATEAVNAFYRREPLAVFEALLIKAAGTLFGVEANTPNYGKRGFYFIGTESDVALAEVFYPYLLNQVEGIYKEALPKGLSKRDRAEFRTSFKNGCALRVLERAKDLIRDMSTNEASAQASTGHNALVVASHFKTKADAITAWWDERLAEIDKQAAQREAAGGRKPKPRKGRPGRSVKMGYGARAGYQAGDRVKLREEIK
jgi:hypothetical protein